MLNFSTVSLPSATALKKSLYTVEDIDDKHTKVAKAAGEFWKLTDTYQNSHSNSQDVLEANSRSGIKNHEFFNPYMFMGA